MNELPFDLHLAKLILISPDYQSSTEIVAIVSCLIVPQLFMRPRDNPKATDTTKAQFTYADSDLEQAYIRH